MHDPSWSNPGLGANAPPQVIKSPSHWFTEVVFQVGHFLTMAAVVSRLVTPGHAICPPQVEDTLFRVPRHHFEQQSEVFSAMFQLPVASGTVADGSSEHQPLQLPGVTKADFEHLLRLMFPS